MNKLRLMWAFFAAAVLAQVVAWIIALTNASEDGLTTGSVVAFSIAMGVSLVFVALAARAAAAFLKGDNR